MSDKSVLVPRCCASRAPLHADFAACRGVDLGFDGLHEGGVELRHVFCRLDAEGSASEPLADIARQSPRTASHISMLTSNAQAKG
eukprot:1008250-Rhodomonas_salina.3